MSAQFDEYADDYERALNQGLSAVGEGKDYFASGRVRWLSDCLKSLSPRPTLRAVLDYGCGSGATIPLLKQLGSDVRCVGVDVSAQSLTLARRDFGNDQARFALVEEQVPNADFSLAYCNGIFHHILPAERLSAARYVYDSLEPGGVFSFWENNPWNPGTRWVMSRIPFDRDAIPVSASQARKLLERAGFRVLRTDFLFIFPRQLRQLRFLEAKLSRLPLGGQYQVLCKKA